MEEKGYDPLVYRMFCLQSHYRKNLVFSYESLDNTAAAYEKLVARIAALAPQEGDLLDEEAAKTLREKFRQAMDNDLNTSMGLTALYDVLKYPTNDHTKWTMLGEFDQVLSLGLLEKAQAVREAKAAAPASPEDAKIQELIDARQAARKAKDFAKADKIRDELAAMGIQLKDTPQGVEWSRK